VKLDERERSQLFELWTRGAPFPEIVTVVDSFVQDAATRASGDAATARTHTHADRERTGGGADG